MQTFLPYPGFAANAAVLDDRRLGKQRVEALELMHRNADGADQSPVSAASRRTNSTARDRPAAGPR